MSQWDKIHAHKNRSELREEEIYIDVRDEDYDVVSGFGPGSKGP
jgi:hypothetical protein